MANEQPKTPPAPTISADELKQLISKIMLLIRMRSPFFATLMLHAKFIANYGIPTAFTNGRDVNYNPEFLMKLPSRQQVGVLLHEVLHMALSHVFRCGTREPQIWNLATDTVVNGILRKQDYCELIAGAITDPKLEDLTAEEIYEILMKQYEEERKKAQSGKNGGAGGKGSPKGSGGKGKEQGDGEGDGGAGSSVADKSKRFKESPCFGHSHPSEKPQDGEGETMQDILRRMAESEAYWKNALRQAEIIQRQSGQGSMPAGWDRLASLIEQPQMDWRSLLWRYLVRTPTDFSGYDRRMIPRGYYLEQLEGDSVCVYICIDTSGSIDDKQLSLFLGEVHGILGSYPHLKAQLFYADADLYGPYEIDKKTEIPPAKGGGGTSFLPFFEKVKELHVTQDTGIAVYLTDGYGSFPEKDSVSIDTLWVVVPGGLTSDNFPFGEVARLLQEG